MVVVTIHVRRVPRLQVDVGAIAYEVDRCDLHRLVVGTARWHGDELKVLVAVRLSLPNHDHVHVAVGIDVHIVDGRGAIVHDRLERGCVRRTAVANQPDDGFEIELFRTKQVVLLLHRIGISFLTPDGHECAPDEEEDDVTEPCEPLLMCHGTNPLSWEFRHWGYFPMAFPLRGEGCAIS